MPTCQKCQTVALPDDKFCGHCGYDIHAATTELSTLTEHSLDVVEVKFRLGMVYYKKDNMESAVALWKEVLELDKGHADAIRMMERVQSNQGPTSNDDE